MADNARIAVIGAGLMGHGLAQVFALGGHDVTIYDSFDASRFGFDEPVIHLFHPRAAGWAL